MDVREKYVIQKVNRKEKSICPNCIHHNLCIAEDNQPCFECNRFIDAHGVTVQEWIPASEPPEEKGCYLVSVKHWLDGKPVTREAFWNGADWLSCYWGKGDRVELTPRVTHWQYLPQPPEGE